MNSLYISDLDGTLLTNTATLSAFSKAELQRLIVEGIDFSVASARSVASIRSILQGLHLKLPVIEFNGAFITDLETGRHEIVNAMDQEIVSDLYELSVCCGCKPFISTFNGKEDCLYYCEILNEGMRWYVDDRTKNLDRGLRKVNDLRSTFREQVVCVLNIGTQEVLSDLALSVHERHGLSVEIHFFENRYSRGWHWLTVQDKWASKDQAVRTLMQAIGLSDKELVVFGDQINDLKLFGIATESVAVGNAVPEIIERATHVIGTNEEDSVVKHIRQHWNHKLGVGAV